MSEYSLPFNFNLPTIDQIFYSTTRRTHFSITFSSIGIRARKSININHRRNYTPS